MSPLLHVLNSECRLPGNPLNCRRFSLREVEAVFAASTDQLKHLNLYADLSWLPKNIDLARDPMKDDIVAEVESGTPEELSIRQQGRLRHKKALISKLQKGESGPGSSATPATLNEEPEPKKVKQGHPVNEDKMDEV